MFPRTSLMLGAVAVAAAALAGAARAEVLVYEPFLYPFGEELGGQDVSLSATGLTSTWSTLAWGYDDGWIQLPVPMLTDGSETEDPGDGDSYTQGWDGVCDHLTPVGNFASIPKNQGRAHIEAYVEMDPSVTSAFTSGTSTWIAGIVHSTGPWGYWHTLGIGNGHVKENDRADKATGQILAGSSAYDDHGPSGAVYFEDDNGDGTYTNHNSGDLPGEEEPGLLVAKFTWDDPSSGGEDTVEAYRFDISPGSDAPTEAAFNANAVSNSHDFDQSTFDTLTWGGGRMELDEIRIATTFDEALYGVPGPEVDGDLDGDGDVDLLDFGVFQANFTGPDGSGMTPGDGDLDGDGDVDLLDFGVFQANFTGPGGGMTVNPEPATLALLALGGAGLLLGRKQKGSRGESRE